MLVRVLVMWWWHKIREIVHLFRETELIYRNNPVILQIGETEMGWDSLTQNASPVLGS